MKIVAQNKKAFREYEILEKFEAGIVLTGTEVKSARAGKVQLVDSYVQIRGDEAYLHKTNIAEYEQGNWTNHEPTRTRKLLLHKKEIRRLRGKADERGFSIIPIKVYLNDKGKVKVEIALGRGKKLHDKRQDLKEREADRSIRRELRRGS